MAQIKYTISQCHSTIIISIVVSFVALDPLEPLSVKICYNNSSKYLVLIGYNIITLILSLFGSCIAMYLSCLHTIFIARPCIDDVSWSLNDTFGALLLNFQIWLHVIVHFGNEDLRENIVFIQLSVFIIHHTAV